MSVIKNLKMSLLMIILMASCSPIQNTSVPTPSTPGQVERPQNTPTSLPPPAKPTERPPEYPPARGFSQLLVHPPTGKLILFGGESNRRISYADTWEYDPVTNLWTQRFPDTHPSGVDGASAVYNSAADKFIFYFSVALDRSAPSGLVKISETWTYDFTANTWENMNPASHPEGLMGPRMAYDTESDRTILFGGADFTASETTTFTETWAYDYNTNAWEKMDPNQTPIGRSYFGMAYVPGQDQVFVFGGNIQAEDENRQNELWAYDYNADTWNEISFSGEPHPDHHPMMVYDPITDQLLYLVNNDLDSFDLKASSWETITTAPSNSPIHFQAMAVDAIGNLIVFGGGPMGLSYNNNTFKYSLATQEWERLGP